MTKPKTVRLTQQQEEFIKKQKINSSEFIRRSVDYYILHLNNPYNSMLLAELEQWIQMKKDETVLQNNTNVLDKNTDVLDKNTSVLDKNTNVLICNTENQQTNKQINNNNKQQQQTSIKKILENDLDLIHRVLNAPANAGVVPDTTFKILTKRYDLSKSTIQGWIAENRDALKNGEFEKISN